MVEKDKKNNTFLMRFNWNERLFSYSEIELLAQHGVMKSPEMLGLTEQQVEELKIKDNFAEVCIPSGGFVVNPDPVGRRTGRGNVRAFVDMVMLLVGLSSRSKTV